MSSGATPLSVSTSVMFARPSLTSVWATSRDSLFETTPRLIRAVSGSTLTVPVPFTLIVRITSSPGSGVDSWALTNGEMRSESPSMRAATMPNLALRCGKVSDRIVDLLCDVQRVCQVLRVIDPNGRMLVSEFDDAVAVKEVPRFRICLRGTVDRPAQAQTKDP